MSFYRVPTRLLPDLWPAIEPHAVKACEHHPYIDASDLLAILLAGKAQLFLATNEGGVLGFAAAEVVEYPRRKVAQVIAAAGARGFLGVLTGPLLELMQEWAVEQGADTFAVIGRPGWLKTARRIGASELHTCVAWVRLGDGRRRRNAKDSLGAVEGVTAVPEGHLQSGAEPLPAA